MDRKVICIDMDDTICDFSVAHAAHLVMNPDIKYPQSQYGFFANLRPIEHAVEIVNLMRQDFDIHILTRPSVLNPLCWTEKAEWIRYYFGKGMLENLTITSHKHRFIGDYLIDDKEWPGFLGEQILFGQDPFLTWKDVYLYIMSKENKMN